MRALSLLPFLWACGQDYDLTAEQGRLELTPSFHDLGYIAVGSTASAEVGLYATAGEVDVLAVEVLNVDGSAFSVVHDELKGLTDETAGVVEVVYAPTTEGYHWASITVLTDENDDNEHLIEVRGGAAQPAARLYPPLVDFGPLDAGEEGTATVTVVNQSAVALSLTAFDFDAPSFASPEGLPLDIPADEAVELTLSVSSTGAEETGTVTLDFDGLVSLDPVDLQVNACSNPIASLYDADEDGYSACATDCDDDDDTVNPGTPEACDGVDNDCDGTFDEGTDVYDDDGDGHTENDGDCDDDDNTVYPGSTEAADGVDDDCDGIVDEGTSRYDDDGDGYTELGGDCDDADSSVSPAEQETEGNGVDDDCDGVTS